MVESGWQLFILGLFVGALIRGCAEQPRRPSRGGYQPKKGKGYLDLSNPPTGGSAVTPAKRRVKPTPSPRRKHT